MKNQSEKGFTLIELILVIGIMSIVTAAIFSFLLFQNRMFNKASDKFDIQAETRLALSQIDKQLRNCDELTLVRVSTAESDMLNIKPVNTNYIVIANDGTITTYIYNTASSTGYTEKVIASHIVGDISKSYFEKISNKILKVNISGVSNNESYSLDTEILLNNMTLGGGIALETIDTSQLAVKYTK